ncbi:MAG: AAA family ATPase [Deltaproteobacteria bacterium]|nr:AAA family ATPase [Deltaproteobacteria bacterium]
MSVHLDALLDRRLVVCVGPGGVGKTTSAAALALRAARQGRRALVLTIDPARRLADALGLDGLDDTIRVVDDEPNLSAAMLDTKASYDALMGRIAEPDARETILGNRVYQAFSKTLARSHAYVAAERLYDVLDKGDHDLVVLDTPPTRSALEILDAPHQLARFLDDGVLRFFLEPDDSIMGSLASLASAGGRAAMKLLGKLAGEEVTAELLGFFHLLADQREGFLERAQSTAATLRDPATGYALVASTSTTALADARALASELAERHRTPSLFLFNRAYLSEPGASTPLAGASPELPEGELQPAAEELRVLREHIADTQRAALESAARFRDSFDPEAPALAVAESPEDIRTLEALGRLLDRSVPV